MSRKYQEPATKFRTKKQSKKPENIENKKSKSEKQRQKYLSS